MIRLLGLLNYNINNKEELIVAVVDLINLRPLALIAGGGSQGYPYNSNHTEVFLVS